MKIKEKIKRNTSGQGFAPASPLWPPSAQDKTINQVFYIGEEKIEEKNKQKISKFVSKLYLNLLTQMEFCGILYSAKL